MVHYKTVTKGLRRPVLSLVETRKFFLFSSVIPSPSVGLLHLVAVHPSCGRESRVDQPLERRASFS